MKKKQNKTVDDKIRKKIDEKFLTPEYMDLNEKLGKITKNIPKAYECENKINESFEKIEKAYKNSKCNVPKRCEEVFLLQLARIENYSKITGNLEYKEISDEMLTKYNKLINRKTSLPNKVSLNKVGLESFVSPLPDNREEKAVALLERNTQDPDNFSIV